jgi:hypothetical protein
MPFEVFRRHQRKLLAIFAILAMFGFVVSDSLPKLLSPSYGGRDQPVAQLYGKTIYRSVLNQMLDERVLANNYVFDLVRMMGRYELLQYMGPQPFGGTKDRDLVDALILEHEADRLGLPGGPDVGREFLKKITDNKMTRELFEMLLYRSNKQISGEQLLRDIANQVRIANVRRLLGSPLVTPYDVFRAYREQNERVSAKAIEVPVARFLAQVPEPSQADIEGLFNQYKDVLPDSARETPGFKVPRKIQFEILSIDGNALARSIKDKLTEAELRTAYENHKPEYPRRPGPTDLPVDLFAGSPELTPPTLRSFDEVRNELAIALAEERAQAEISEKFGKIKDEVLIPFADKYVAVLDEIEEAKKQGVTPTARLPVPDGLKELAQREGLTDEVTPLLSRDQAEHYGQVSSAEVGGVKLSGERKFAEEFFDPKKGLYEPEELTDSLGTRFLVRKIQDVRAHVPALDEVRTDVSLAWKTAKARVLAEKAANELAPELKKKGSVVKDPTVSGYRVVSIPPLTRRQPALLASRMDSDVPEETPIPDVAYAGDEFRNAFFQLEPGKVTVAPNLPKTDYYVLTLDKREPATFASLFAPNGDEFRYKMLTRNQAARKLDDEWMGWLRRQAGLQPDWRPDDEVKAKAAADEA